MRYFEKLQKIVSQDHSLAGEALRNVLTLHDHSGGTCEHCGGDWSTPTDCETVEAIAAAYYPESIPFSGCGLMMNAAGVSALRGAAGFER